MTVARGVLVERNDGVLALTLDRPARLNALTTELTLSLVDLVETAAHDSGVRVITLTGAGRAFCAGADLDPAERGREGLLPDTSLIDAANRLVLALRSAPKPVVALVNGAAVGVGSSLVLAADLALASTSAYLALGFDKIGLMPDGGGTALLPAAVGRSRALSLALLGDRITAQQAGEWGIFARVWGADEFPVHAAALVARLADGPTLGFAATKAGIDAAALPGLSPALELERRHQRTLLASADFAEGAGAFAEKRPPRFTGA